MSLVEVLHTSYQSLPVNRASVAVAGAGSCKGVALASSIRCRCCSVCFAVRNKNPKPKSNQKNQEFHFKKCIVYGNIMKYLSFGLVKWLHNATDTQMVLWLGQTVKFVYILKPPTFECVLTFEIHQASCQNWLSQAVESKRPRCATAQESSYKATWHPVSLHRCMGGRKK